MNEILAKLDLTGYVDEFCAHLARQKPLFLEGDSKLHFARICELQEFDFAPPPSCENLSQSLMHLSKQGILHLNESFEFIKILRYFSYLKGLKFELSLNRGLTKSLSHRLFLSFVRILRARASLKTALMSGLCGLMKRERLKANK